MDDYTPPTPGEVRSLLGAMGLTGAAAATVMGLSDGRQVRKYTGGSEPRRLSFAALYTLVHRCTGRRITPGAWRREIADLVMAQSPQASSPQGQG